MNKRKIASQEEVFKGPLFTVTKTEFKLEDGLKKVHYNVHRRPTVSIFPIDDKGNIYLISQYRVLYKRDFIEAVAGYIDSGEEPITAAKRELQEETGITAKTWVDLGAVQMAASAIKAESYLFLAKDLSFGRDNPEPGEVISLKKIHIKEATQKVLSGEITTSISMIGILKLAMMKESLR
jgi:ADP-ribose pyrophosphatase